MSGSTCSVARGQRQPEQRAHAERQSRRLDVLVEAVRVAAIAHAHTNCWDASTERDVRVGAGDLIGYADTFGQVGSTGQLRQRVLARNAAGRTIANCLDLKRHAWLGGARVCDDVLDLADQPL